MWMRKKDYIRLLVRIAEVEGTQIEILKHIADITEVLKEWQQRGYIKH